MDRKTKRENKRMILSLRHKAVKDMNAWLDSLDHPPTANEVKAFQDGYIAGVNRGNQQ
jgi:hypothetical protein